MMNNSNIDRREFVKKAGLERDQILKLLRKMIANIENHQSSPENDL